MRLRQVVAPVLALFLCVAGSGALGQRGGEGNIRPIPPPGVAVPEADKAELETGIAELGKQIEALKSSLSNPALLELLPDVQIYHNAARYALTYNEFFNAREIPVAKALLKQGMERAQQLKEGKADWTTQTGLVVRGYVSKIDGSVQPYGLVIPASWQPGTATRFRLDAWFHGRGETLSEVNFINDRQRNRGEFAPPNTFMLHLYGRFCNANRFAGEIDLFEALESVKKRYPIDDNRIVMRGFSMGGAACWQFATHFAGEWAAAAPGAGFSETEGFLRLSRTGENAPPWYEQKLWHQYDSIDYAVNMFNCPLVAYSGEKDGQKQAADMMEKALAAEGITMTHVIGAGAGHNYTPDAREEINRRLDSIVALGRNPVPRQIRFTTWTLRYNKMFWLTVNGLGQHWERARVDAEFTKPDTIQLKTKNVTALTLSMPPGHCPLDNTRTPTVILDGQRVKGPAVLSDRSWEANFHKSEGKWYLGPRLPLPPRLGEALPFIPPKMHGLQGPIDDAFMDSFLIVGPTGTAMNEKVGAWTKSELEHAIKHWRIQFRGEARVKNDAEVNDADIAAHNLILFGDPQSNKVLARIADRLPIKWTAQGVQVGAKTYTADHHAPVLIFPNPLNPKRYVVLNSGFTFREFDYLNNARQSPKLPDYAVVDLNIPPSPRTPGGIVDAGFFNEQWALGK